MLTSLIQQAQSGDNESMEKLLIQFQPLLKKYAYKLHYEDSLNDLVLFFIELILSLPSSLLKQDSDGKTINYIAVSIKNHYCHLVKRRIDEKNEICFSQLNDEQSYYINSCLTMPDSFEAETVFSIIKKILTQREFEIIIYIYYFNYSSADIARVKNVSRQSVNQIKKRALSKLKKNLQKE